MDIYMYQYKCPRWYRTITGFRNLYVEEKKNETEVIDIAKQESNKLSGSKSCSVNLLQKFNVLIKPIKNYPALVSIPLTLSKNNIQLPDISKNI